MVNKIELSSLDLRYEGYRLKNPAFEKSLYDSIHDYGIKEPLQGINKADSKILLDGFKRYRCAKKLSLGVVPYSCLSDDEAMGIIKLIRRSITGGLNILEHAGLIDELISVYKMSYSEIATHLEKSKSWVAMRAGLIGQMSEKVKELIFEGKFPAYSFMYTLRPFIRMNGIKKREVEKFVQLVSGKRLSIRDIDLLARGYFNGGDDFRQQIERGDIRLCLDSLKGGEDDTTDCSEVERKFLKELEITKSYMHRVICRARDTRISSNSFYSQATLLASSILKQSDKFRAVMEDIYGRCRDT